MQYESYNPDYNDVTQSVEYLSRAFARARQDYVKATKEKSERDPFTGKTTGLYEYEVDFSYLINEIQRGPVYMITKNIADANELIRQFQAESST